MEPWSNGACLGYVIDALERLGYPEGEIQKIVNEIKYVGFDETTVRAADRHYCSSPY